MVFVTGGSGILLSSTLVFAIVLCGECKCGKVPLELETASDFVRIRRKTCSESSAPAIGNQSGNGNGNGSGTVNGIRDGSGTGIMNRNGSGTGTGNRNGSGTEIGIRDGSGTGTGNGNGSGTGNGMVPV